MLKGRIVTLEETINVHEMEAKANRETIMRLASEVNREQKKAASWAEERDQLEQVQPGKGVYTCGPVCDADRWGGTGGLKRAIQ